MSSYSFDFNNRLNTNFHYQPGINEEGQVDDLLRNQMNELDKFVIFVDPSRVKFKFLTLPEESTIGDAKRLIEANRSKTEEYINGRLITDAQQRFNSLDSVLEFVSSNKELLELMSKDGRFRNEVFNKIRQIINILEAKEKTLNSVDSFFSKVAHLATGKNWETQLERARQVQHELFDKFFGRLEVDGFKKLFGKKEAWTGPEHLRAFFQLDIRASINEMDLGIFEEKGVKTSRLITFEEALNACWEGMSQSYIESLTSNSSNYYDSHGIFFERFLSLYHLITSESQDKSFREFCYKSIFEKANGEELERFMNMFNEVNRLFGGGLQIERSEEMLNCVPLKKYFNAFPWRRDLRLAASYFIQSIKEGDVHGISLASQLLRGVEYEQEMIRTLKTTSRYFTPEDSYGIDTTDYPNYIYDSVKFFLNNEDFEIFRNNYQSRFQEEETVLVEEGIVQERPMIPVSSVESSYMEVVPIEPSEKLEITEREEDLTIATGKFVEHLRGDLIELRWLCLSGDRKENDDKGKGNVRSDQKTLSAIIVGTLNQFFDRHHILSWEEQIDFIHQQMHLMPEEQRILDLLYTKPLDIQEELDLWDAQNGGADYLGSVASTPSIPTRKELKARFKLLQTPIQPLPSMEDLEARLMALSLPIPPVHTPESSLNLQALRENT